MSFDLVIRGGTVVDGSGGPARTADVAIRGGRIVEVGQVDGKGHREIAADGALVTPGFVDIHTHYDGQATWDERLQPSSLHGVTTVVTGNCGVGFAPVRPSDHTTLVELMEGVEDLPGTVLNEGLSWEWESITDYLSALERRHYDIDVAAPRCASSSWASAVGDDAGVGPAPVHFLVAVERRRGLPQATGAARYGP
jgi:N-acyl-D-aspartate/D-glutamate deacylase